MRYSTEPKYRKYVKQYGFLSFARRFGYKYGKKLMDTAKSKTKQNKTNKKTNKTIQNRNRRCKNCF